MKNNDANARAYLRETRLKLGYTQRGLGIVTGYTRADIRNYESGAARVPGDLILRIQEIEKASSRVAKGDQA